jgi:hypothetical protein
LSEIGPAKRDEKLAVVKDQKIRAGEGIGANILISESVPVGAVLETEP